MSFDEPDFTRDEHDECRRAYEMTKAERDALRAELDEAQNLAIKRGEIQVRLTKERDTWKFLHDELGATQRAERAEMDDLRKQLAVEVAVNADYPDVVADRDRYLDALKAEAIAKQGWAESQWGDYGLVLIKHVGGITLRITRNPDGSLQAEEVE